MPAGGGVAGQPVCAYLVGRTSLVLVDPGDPTGPALDRAIAIAADRGGSIAAIALTHPDPDHAAGAEALAEQLDIPVLVGAGGGRDLPYVVLELVDGDGHRCRRRPAPGRRHARPARRDTSRSWSGDGGLVLTGDLEGPRGARSIPGPTDEEARAGSVARLRSVAPGARWLAGHPDLA